jgi:hypothetical protein
MKYPWHARYATGQSAPAQREPTVTTKTINTPITNHDANVVAWVPGPGFIAGCDKYAVSMLSQDAVNWGGAATSRIIGEVPLNVIDGTVYGVDTEISGYEKIVTQDTANYPDFRVAKLGVTQLTDVVNCWANSSSEILLLEGGNKLTRIPRDNVPTAPAGTPSAPLSLNAVAGRASVALSWLAPATNGTSAVTDYKIEYTADLCRTWSTFSRSASTALSTTVTGLANYTTYLFRVSAINASGTGVYSALSSAVTPKPTVPSAPTNVVATPTGPKNSYGYNTQFAVSWAAPADDGGSSITGYIVQSHDGRVTYATLKTAATSYTTSYTFSIGKALYGFRVIAVNALGNSAASTPTTTQPMR